MSLENNAINFSHFKMFGHNRTASMEFIDLTNRDRVKNMALELDRLRVTGNLTSEQKAMHDKEFDNFQQLYSKYINEQTKTQEAIVWDKIEKLPAGAVSKSSLA